MMLSRHCCTYSTWTAMNNKRRYQSSLLSLFYKVIQALIDDNFNMRAFTKFFSFLLDNLQNFYRLAINLFSFDIIKLCLSYLFSSLQCNQIKFHGILKPSKLSIAGQFII